MSQIVMDGLNDPLPGGIKIREFRRVEFRLDWAAVKSRLEQQPSGSE